MSPFQGFCFAHFTLHYHPAFLSCILFTYVFFQQAFIEYLLWTQMQGSIEPGGGVVAALSQLIVQRWESSFILLTLTAQFQDQQTRLRHPLNQFCHPGMGGGD
jgi:hypothetical protein